MVSSKRHCPTDSVHFGKSYAKIVINRIPQLEDLGVEQLADLDLMTLDDWLQAGDLVLCVLRGRWLGSVCAEREVA